MKNNKLNDIGKGYIAGFWDAEGTISITKNKHWCNRNGFSLRPRLAVFNTNLDVIKYIQSKVGGKMSRFRQRSSKHKICYKLVINLRKYMIEVLVLIKDYLRVKKECAETLLEYCKLRDDKYKLCGLVRHRDRSESTLYDEREWDLYKTMRKLSKWGR